MRTNSNGLSTEERKNRLQQNGPNVLAQAKRHGSLYFFLKAQCDMFAGLIWLAIVICFIIFGITQVKKIAGQEYTLYLAIALILLNVLSGILSFTQNSASQKTIDGFSKLIPARCSVLQDGVTVDELVENLVVGDVVFLKAGSKVPADVRIMSSNKLKVDMSSFTGESEPVALSLESDAARLLDATNMAFFTSPISSGEGCGVVVAVGNDTQIGIQKKQIDSVKAVKTPIQKEITVFVKILSGVSILIGVVFFGLGMLVGVSAINSFIFAVSIIIANVPEGMTLSVTVTLAKAAKRLAKKNVLVKSLSDVETLGSITVICSDKTGTITRNQMTVAHVYDTEALTEVKWNFAEEKPEIELNENVKAVLALNSRSTFDAADQEPSALKRNVIGDASETGILRFMELYYKNRSDDLQEFKKQHGKKFEIPFNSAHKFQLSVHEHTQEHDLVTLKGAPERVFKVCNYWGSEKVPIVDDEERYTQRFETAYKEAAGLGERVIGLAYGVQAARSGYESEEDVTASMVFIGFVALQDPPKDGVADAVRQCHEAQVKVTMVTGDHYLTAAAISKQVGILQSGIDYYVDVSKVDFVAERESFTLNPDGRSSIQRNSCVVSREQKLYNRLSQVPQQFVPRNHNDGAVMTGEFLEKISLDQLMIFLEAYDEVVFARTTPDQKLKIVQAYQGLFHVACVSGDGGNDAPALKQADVGVAMASGSDIAIDAARIVLVDNSFCSICEGVKQGRLIFDNLKKGAAYAISTTTPEIIPFLLYVILGFPNALNAIVIILIDLATSIWPSFAMASEVPEADLMRRPPRSSKDKLFNGRVCWNSYLRTGAMQALTLLINFMICVSREVKKYTGTALPWKYFSSLKHADFPTVTLVNFIQEHGLIKYPGKTTTTVEAGRYIFQIGMANAFLSIVETQIAHAMAGRMRKNSIAQQGLFTNPGIWWSILIMVGVACVMIYVPFLHTILETQPVPWEYWLICLPFALFIFAYDELRRFLIRRFPKRCQILFW